MLYFRDYDWLLVHGYSHFHAYITPQKKTREQVTWFLDLAYRATGRAWTRVQWFHRPSLWLPLSSFQAPVESWHGLEKLSFWDLPGAEDWLPYHKRGFLDFAFHPQEEGKENEIANGMGDQLWRVAAREGRW